MAKLTKIERDAVTEAITSIQSGDAVAFFNGGREVDQTPGRRLTKEERRAVELAAALDRANMKI